MSNIIALYGYRMGLVKHMLRKCNKSRLENPDNRRSASLIRARQTISCKGPAP